MRQARQVLLALSFLTRIPVRRLNLSKADFAQAAVYFPVIGTLIGGIGAGLFWLLHLLFSTSVSVALTLGALMLLTGALHEDGLADAFDAFGSKVTKDDILETMRDSRIGTYAGLALIMAVLVKFLALNEMRPQVIIVAFVIAHTVSRWAMLPGLAVLPYPRKSAAVTKRFVEEVAAMPKWHLGVSGVYALTISSLLAGWQGVILMLVASVAGLLGIWYFWRKLQGATGDCYGTIQQLAEVAVYLAVLKVL